MTLLFTDVEGSTSVLRALGQRGLAAHPWPPGGRIRDALELRLDPPDALVLEKAVAPLRARTDPESRRADVEAGRSLGVEGALEEALA